ncbi:MAG: DUF4234 domain-containing protein [Acidimicrobiia bacterium]
MAQPAPPSPPPAAARGPIGTPRSPGMQILLAIVTLGIYTFFWVYWQHKEMKEYSGEGIGGGLGVVIYFFISPVTYFLIPSEIRNLYQAEGRDPGFTPLIGLWFLLPIIGNFIWFFKVQPAINEFWISKGAPAPA